MRSADFHPIGRLSFDTSEQASQIQMSVKTVEKLGSNYSIFEKNSRKSQKTKLKSVLRVHDPQGTPAEQVCGFRRTRRRLEVWKLHQGGRLVPDLSRHEHPAPNEHSAQGPGDLGVVHDGREAIAEVSGIKTMSFMESTYLPTNTRAHLGEVSCVSRNTSASRRTTWSWSSAPSLRSEATLLAAPPAQMELSGVPGTDCASDVPPETVEELRATDGVSV